MAAKCKGKKKSGEPCGAFPIQGSAFCYFHDPDNHKARKRASAKGGRTRGKKNDNGKPPRLETFKSTLVVLDQALADAWAMEQKTGNRARALGYLADIASGVFENMRRESKFADILQEIKILKADIEELKRSK